MFNDNATAEKHKQNRQTYSYTQKKISRSYQSFHKIQRI